MHPQGYPATRVERNTADTPGPGGVPARIADGLVAVSRMVRQLAGVHQLHFAAGSSINRVGARHAAGETDVSTGARANASLVRPTAQPAGNRLARPTLHASLLQQVATQCVDTWARMRHDLRYRTFIACSGAGIRRIAFPTCSSTYSSWDHYAVPVGDS